MAAAKKKSKTVSKTSPASNPIVGVIAPVVTPSNSIARIIPMSKIGSATGETTYYTVPSKRQLRVIGVYKLQDNFYTDFIDSGVVFRDDSGAEIFRIQPADDDTLSVTSIGQNLISNNTWKLNPNFTVGLLHKTTDGAGRLAFTVVGIEEDFTEV